MNKFVFSLAPRPAIKEVFSDLENESEVEIIYKPYQISSPIISLFYRIHMSKKINDIVNLPFKSIWKQFYTIDKIDWNEKDNNYLIIIDSSLVWYSASYLNKLREKKNVKLILLLFNPMSKLIKNQTFMNIYNKIKFDLKFSTFDVRDPKEYGCLQTYCVYSKISLSSHETKTDIVYLGMDKGRYETIVSILKKVKEKNYSADFSIINCKLDLSNRDNGINYISEVPYSIYLNKLVNSKCILEIVQTGQKGITLRTFEAIVYGKHLLTNNSYVKEIPFYNERYMHTFDSIDDVDLSFLNSDKEVDYGYDGEFSPVFLKEEILRHML